MIPKIQPDNLKDNLKISITNLKSEIKYFVKQIVFKLALVYQGLNVIPYLPAPEKVIQK